jgi:hypothetical protein
MRLSRSNARWQGCLVALIFAVAILCIIVVAGSGLWPFIREDGQFRFSFALIIPLCVLLIFVVVGLGFGIKALRPFLSGLQVAAPELTISKETLRVGEAFTLSYRQRFKRSVDVDKIFVGLVLRETARYRVGTDTRTVTHDHVVQRRDYAGRHYNAGQSFELQIEMQIPEDGMHTFSATNNKLHWHIAVEVEVSDWPNLEETFEINVLPEHVGV